MKIMGWIIDPGKQAVSFHRTVNWFYSKKGLGILAPLLSRLNLFLTGVLIEPGAKLGEGIRIYHGTGTVIGHTAVVEENCIILHGVTLGAKDFKSMIPKTRIHPKLEEFVTVYTGAVLVGPITIGHHSTIGANAVVTKDIPPYSTVVGNPGKIIKTETSILYVRNM